MYVKLRSLCSNVSPRFIFSVFFKTHMTKESGVATSPKVLDIIYPSYRMGLHPGVGFILYNAFEVDEYKHNKHKLF